MAQYRIFSTPFAKVYPMYVQKAERRPNSSLIKGVVCGVRVEDVEDPLMRKLRYLDKLIDELAKGC